jgi:RimJ/RimL family protein N-acetyltransferase
MPNEAQFGSDLQFRLLLPSDAEAMISWRYSVPYSEYDLDSHDGKVLAELLHPGNNYRAILRNEELIGFFCFGPDARVPGWSYDDHARDLGMGLRPDLTGKGKGHAYLLAVLFYLEQRQLSGKLRATIAAWNLRAIRVCERAGFRAIATFKKPGVGQKYVVLLREA